MRTLVLRIANADALASVNIELALSNAAGQQTLDFATLEATAAALVDEEQVALKYEDSDGDVVTIASDADLREVIEFMDDEDKSRLDVVIKTSSSVVKQHFLGLVAAVTKLANKMEIAEPKQEEVKLTVEDVMEMLYSAVEEWELAEDVEELCSIKADLLSLLDNEHLGTTVAELSGSEEYCAFMDQLLDAVKRGESVEAVVTSQWEAAVGFVKDVLVRCPELKSDLICVAKICVTGLALFNKELLAQEMMPTLERAADVEDEVKPATQEAVAEDEIATAAVVHEHFRCDGCDTSPIVGPRFRSSRNASFDLCRACHSSGQFDAEHAPFTKYVEPQHVHFGVACDGCDQVPIAGVRYKALMVNNFDLCEACEASGKWTAQEPFIKIKNPSQVPQHIEVHIEPPAGAPQLHPFVTCDGCEMHPLVGKRYKSTSVHDFDLCEGCHSSGAWAETHGPFDVVDALNNFRGFKKWWKHEKKAQKCEKKAQKCFEKAMRTRGASGMHPPPPPPPGPRPGPPGPHPRPHPHPHPHPPRPDHHGHHHHDHGHHHHDHGHHHHGHHHHGHHHHGHHHHGHHGHHHGHHDHHGRGAVPVTASPVLAASFVEDVTIPDGTLVAPEVELVKAWKVKNTGTTAWPEGCAMKMQTGRFGVAPFDGEPDLINARVPPLASGEEFIVEVQLQTPSEPGRHTAYWRMCDPSDNGFGHRFWMDVVVSPSLDGVSIDKVDPVELPSAMPVINAAAADVPVTIAHEENDGELVDMYSDSDDESAVEIASTVTTDDSSSDNDSDKNDEDASDKSDVSTSDASEGEDVDGDEEEVVVTTTATVSEVHSSHVEDVVLELCDEALVVLEAMGFGDRENNRRTLAQWGGNLADAVNSLLIDA